MNLKIKDEYEVYVVPKGTAQIVGPLTFDEFVENVLEETDRIDEAGSTAEQASLPLFDREPAEQEDTGTSGTSEDRTSTYGGL